MSELIKLSQTVCLSCKYHMGVGTQPGKNQKAQGMLPNVGCNYLKITGRSRIYENGKKAYNAAYCDKYEKGKPDRPNIHLGDVEYEEYDKYKVRKIYKERKIPTI